MDQQRKVLCYVWLLYIVGVFLALGVLVSREVKSMSPRASQWADLTASRPGTILELAKSKQWMSQVRFFNKTYLAPESSEWHDPPASHVAPADIQPQPADDRFAMLRVTGPEEPLPGNSYFQTVHFGARSSSLGAPTDTLVGPLLRNGMDIMLHLASSRLLGEEPKTQTITVSTNKLSFDQAVAVDLPVLSGYRDELGRDHLHVQLQLTKFDPDRLVTEEEHEAAAQATDIPSKVLEGTVSFDDLKAENRLFITPAGRYTTLIITGDHDLRTHIQCTRTDTGTIVGAYFDHVPMLAVAVNSGASLKVRVKVYDFDQNLHYRIVSLSGNEVTTKALLLWFVAHDLTDKEIEGRILSLPEIDERTRWLKKALGVQFTTEDVGDVYDSEIKQLLAHLTLP